MEINPIGTKQEFNGIRISRHMPKEIAKAIKLTPALKKAGKNYSLHFYFNKRTGQATLDMSSPNTDTFVGLVTTPMHSIKRELFDLGTNTNAILDSIEDIGATPHFFADKIGTPRTIKQELTALSEVFKLACMPKNRTVLQETKVDKILSKYSSMNIQ